jgi:glycosyltransferase involved in cell wall biosynthesis
VKLLLGQNAPYLPGLGGAAKANRLIAEQLVYSGHHVTVVCPLRSRTGESEGLRGTFAARGLEANLDGRSVLRVSIDGVDVCAVSHGRSLRGQLVAQMEAIQPDCTIISSEDPAQVLLEAALTADQGPVVVLAHTTLMLPFGPGGYLRSAHRTRLYQRAAAVVAVSDFLTEYLKRWASVDAETFYIPIYASAPARPVGRFENPHVTLINPCAIKGISIFVELARRLPEVSFAAVPTWGTTAADRRALAELANVTILAPRENIDEILRLTRILLVPSLCYEAFGAVVVEAMLQRIPVLASNLGGLSEAALGAGHLLPVHPIEQYRDEFDEAGIPFAELPTQPVDPWCDALRGLLTDRAAYDTSAEACRQAAETFVSVLSVRPLERILVQATARASRTASSPVEVEGPPHAAGLTAERRALLARELLRRRS